MKSIEQRIRLGLIVTLLVTFTALTVLADFGVKQLSRNFVLTRLQHDSDALIKSMSLSNEQQWLTTVTFIVGSARISDAVTTLGFAKDSIIAENPSNEAMLAALNRWAITTS